MYGAFFKSPMSCDMLVSKYVTKPEMQSEFDDELYECGGMN